LLDEGVRVRIPPPAPDKQQFEEGLWALRLNSVSAPA